MPVLMGVIRWTRDIVQGFWTVLVGMRVTARHLVERPITMHYPDQKSTAEWSLPETFRGLIKVDMDACIVCDLCAKACPVDCITIEWTREEGKAGKKATRFEVDYSKCLYCGLCTQPCPTAAIWHSLEYENSSWERDPHVIDWTLPENRVINPKAKPVKKAEPKPAAKTAAPAAAKPAAPAAEPAGKPVESGEAGKAAKKGTRGKVVKVWIVAGCTVCDVCKEAAPDVFQVDEKKASIRMESRDKWGELSDKIVEAAVGCPVEVIRYELAEG